MLDNEFLIKAIMKTITRFLLVLFISITTLQGQTGWYSPAATSDDFFTVRFVDSLHGWIGGQLANYGSGVIRKTVNGGSSWTTQAIPVTEAINKIVFLNPMTGFAAGNKGTILKTTDGGSNWIKQTTGSIEDLRSLFFITSQIGWACGGINTVLATKDGGATWSIRTVPDAYANMDIAFKNAQEGILVSLYGGCFKTIDGGNNWLHIDDPIPRYTYFGVQYLSATKVVIIGGSQVALSADAGQTWSLPYDIGEQINGICFADSLSGWAVSRSKIVHTTNGGTEWRVQQIPEGGYLMAVNSPDGIHAWAVGFQAILVRRPALASTSLSTIIPVPASIKADGRSTSKITVQIKDTEGANSTSSAGTVTLQTTAGTIGPVTDLKNGTYTAVFTAPTTTGKATITGALDGQPFTGSPAEIFLYSAQIQEPSFVWAKQLTSSDYTITVKVAIDSSDNSYVFGNFSGSLSAGQVQLTSDGGLDLFMAKFDPAGNLVWLKRAGGTGADRSYSVHAEASGNSYIMGTFSGTATFGAFSITTAKTSESFLAKYDPQGNCIWVIKMGGENDWGGDLTVDQHGNIYVTGCFQGTVDFGNQKPLTANGFYDMFVAKYDANGACLWVTGGGGYALDEGTGISLDATGNVYVTGVFSGENTKFGTAVLSTPNIEVFIAKYGNDGTPLWAKQVKGSAYDNASGISTDRDGNSTITGSISAAALFDQFQLPGPETTYLNNTYCAKYDSKGSCLWAVSGTGFNVGAGAIVDAQGNSYIAGRFWGESVFGDRHINSTFTSEHLINPDGFICKYDARGNFLWAKSIGGSGYDVADGIAIDSKGALLVSGECGIGPVFGDITVSGLGGAFIAKLAPEVTSVGALHEGLNSHPSAFSLKQNYPNPFNPSTTISFSLPSRSFVTLKIFDVMGREVATMVSEEMPAGIYSRQWNASGLPSGVYYYRLQAGAFVQTKNLVVLK
jgi:photosystem II stability/assembly factor-like uncharacterized protein